MEDEIRIICVLLLAVTVTLWGSLIMTKLSVLLAAIQAQTSVVASAVTFITAQAAENARLNAQLREHLESGNTDAALGTLEELETAQRTLETNTATLAKAFAANTDSAAEVPAHEDGGIGTSDTVVDPETVEVDPALTSGGGGEDAGGAAAGGEAGSGSGAEAGGGTGDGGAQAGGTQTGAGDGSNIDEAELSGGPGREGTAEAQDGAGQADTGDQSGSGLTGDETAADRA